MNPDAPPSWGDDSSTLPDFTEEKPEKLAPLSPDEFRSTFGDAKIYEAPEPLRMNVFLGAHIPYQALALSLGADIFPAPWLRVSVLYSIGVAALAKHGDAVMSQYAEGAVGFAVSQTASQTTIDFVKKDTVYGKLHPMQAIIPAYHGAFVEGGVLTGLISPARCIAHCDDFFAPGHALVPENSQLVMFFGGARYIYFYRLDSETQDFSKRGGTKCTHTSSAPRSNLHGRASSHGRVISWNERRSVAESVPNWSRYFASRPVSAWAWRLDITRCQLKRWSIFTFRFERHRNLTAIAADASDRLQHGPVGPIRHAKLEHHDGDDDGDDPSLNASSRPFVLPRRSTVYARALGAAEPQW